MRELSLHILDLVENAVRAGATAAIVTVVIDEPADLLRIAVEDNGPGLKNNARPGDPFYTTKPSKQTGLGLALLADAAKHADGEMTVEPSWLGGTAVEVTMRLSHRDRMPLGDLAATIASVTCTNPKLDLRLHVDTASGHYQLRIGDLADARSTPLTLARQAAQHVRELADRIAS